MLPGLARRAPEFCKKNIRSQSLILLLFLGRRVSTGGRSSTALLSLAFGAHRLFLSHPGASCDELAMDAFAFAAARACAASAWGLGCPVMVGQPAVTVAQLGAGAAGVRTPRTRSCGSGYLRFNPSEANK